MVSFTYVLKNAHGEELDRTDEGKPLSYLHGSPEILPGLQLALENSKVGDKKEVTLSPKQGYGERQDSLRLPIQRTAFPPDMEVKPGMHFQAAVAEGQPPVTFTVLSVEADRVLVDGNHPLAGETLHFAVQITEVRDATEQEKTHGHVHGPGDSHGH